MNKDGWTYNSFCNCIQKVVYPESVKSKDYHKEGMYPVISQEAEYISGYNDDSSKLFLINKPVVIFGDHSRVLKYVDFNFIIGADGVKILNTCDFILPKFFYYFLLWFNVPSLGYSRHFKLLKEISSVPIPPKDVQNYIVGELDTLNDTIIKLQQQVKELDSLEQSIFYSTFGDPTINEKGWQVMKLRDGFSYIKNGANIKQDKNASGIPITRIETLSGGVFNRDRLGYADIFSIEKYSNYLMNDGDILMSHINSKAYIGRSVIYRKRENEIIIHGMNLLRLVVIPDLINPTYINAFFKSDYFRNKVARIRKDAVNQSSMAISDLKDIDILVPPLTIQNSYASKVSSIEDAKDSINIQIKEMQTLLSARMQYWFE